MEFFSQKPYAAKAVGALRTIGTMNQILTGNTAPTVDQLTALMAIDGPRGVSAKGTTLAVSNICTAVTIGTIFREGAKCTISTIHRLKGLRVWYLRTSPVKFS